MGKTEKVSAGTDGRREGFGAIPDAGEGGVRLEEVGDDLHTLRLQRVAADAANEGANGLSALSGC